MNRSLYVVLVRARPPEVSEDAISHELGDTTIEARNFACYCILVPMQDVAEDFGIKLR